MADGITRIAVEGFKSIVDRQEIEIAPLTILAGANSSGKSSIMQPLLLLKQTLEATYDPGPLKIDGPNVRFTSSDQFLSKSSHPDQSKLLSVEIDTQHSDFQIVFARGASGMQLSRVGQTKPNKSIFRPGMSSDEITRELSHRDPKMDWSITWRRFFPIAHGRSGSVESETSTMEGWVSQLVEGTIHVPGFRGNSSRAYPIGAVGPTFPGTFEHYTASLILHWQSENGGQYVLLNRDLELMGLAGKVVARKLNDVELDLQVNRLADEESRDLVSIADVGFGVSQTLPVLVALRAAGKRQLVYLEEPEIHLHPRAQTKLADVLADAAKRGVRVVAETHSTLLLTAIQTLVAKGELDRKLVKLHWFQRDPKTGITKVSSADLDENGAFGDWPEDFDEVILDAEGAYLDAVEGRQVG